MNNTNRLLALVLINCLIVAGMLWRLDSLGIDIENTRLIDNADNISFASNLLCFLVVLFYANTALLTYPSSKSNAFKRLVDKVELKKRANIQTKRSRKHPA